MWKVGFIGTGDIATTHAEALLTLPESFQLTKAYDISKPALKEFCGRFSVRLCGSAQEVLTSPEVDVVYICTRHDSHFYYAKEAILNKKAVFLEKPLTMTLEEAQNLHQTFLDGPVPFVVGYNMRMAPAAQELKSILQKQSPKIETFRLSMTGPPFMDGWAGNRVSGGGVLVCQGSHLFDLIEHLFDSEIRKIMVQTQHYEQPEELLANAASAIVLLDNKIMGTVLMHDRGNHAYHVEPGGKMVNLALYAPEGAYELDVYDGVKYVEEGVVREVRPASDQPRLVRWGYQAQAQEFARYLASGTSSLCTMDEGVRVVNVVESARRSDTLEQWVTVKK